MPQSQQVDDDFENCGKLLLFRDQKDRGQLWELEEVAGRDLQTAILSRYPAKNFGEEREAAGKSC
jgi:hypothetical protein